MRRALRDHGGKTFGHSRPTIGCVSTKKTVEVSGQLNPRRRSSVGLNKVETSFLALYLLWAYRRDACATT